MKKRLKRLNILYVEDDRTYARRLKEYFKSKGHKVRVAYTVAQAMRILSRNRFSRIICDGMVEVGKEDGIELARKLKAQGQSVVVFTAGNFPTDLPTLNKDFSPENLDRLLDHK